MTTKLLYYRLPLHLLLLFVIAEKMKTNYYPVHVCAARLCVWSCRFVCVCMYMYIYLYICWQKQAVFSALLLEKLLLSVICHLLFEFKTPPVWFVTSSELYRQSNWNKMRKSPGLEIFFLSFNGTPHPLGYTSSECFSSASMFYMYADWRVQCRTPTTSLGTPLYVQYSQLKCMLSVYRVCVRDGYPAVN